MTSLNHCHPFPLFQSFCCSAAKKSKLKRYLRKAQPLKAQVVKKQLKPAAQNGTDTACAETRLGLRSKHQL